MNIVTGPQHVAIALPPLTTEIALKGLKYGFVWASNLTSVLPELL